MTKKYLLCVLAAAFLLCPGEAFADTFLSSLINEANNFIYYLSENEESGIVMTVCDLQGRELSGEEAENADESVVFYQSPDTTASLYVHDGSDTGMRLTTASFSTRNKNLAFAGGIKIGDPVSKAVNSGVMEGQYFEKAQNGVTVHMWVTQDNSTGFVSLDGKITDVMFLDNYVIQQTQLRNDLTAYLGSPQPAASGKEQPAAQAAAKPGGNTSTDAKMIESYPLESKEKNELSIKHRGAYNLYSQKKYQEAYDIFTTLADRYYGCNYLSAYWAGAAAEKLKHADNARRWYKRALEVNPDYKPAQDALAKLSGEPKSGSGAGSKDGTIWDKYL